MQVDWKLDWKFLFLSFHGRIGRIHFWIAFLLLVGAGVVVQLIPIIGQIAGILLLWPQLTIQAKRLHDMGRTAWFMAIPPAVFFVCGVAAALIGGPLLLSASRRDDSGALAEAAGGLGVIAVLILLPVLVLISFLLWIGLARTQPRDNRYGSIPEVR